MIFAAHHFEHMVTEVGAENNSTTVPMIPSDFVSLSTSLAEYLREHKSVTHVPSLEERPFVPTKKQPFLSGESWMH